MNKLEELTHARREIGVPIIINASRETLYDPYPFRNAICPSSDDDAIGMQIGNAISDDL